MLAEHVSFELYEEWREEASQESGDPAEVRRIVTKRVLLVLAQKIGGEVSNAMRNVAQRM